MEWNSIDSRWIFSHRLAHHSLISSKILTLLIFFFSFCEMSYELCCWLLVAHNSHIPSKTLFYGIVVLLVCFLTKLRKSFKLQFKSVYMLQKEKTTNKICVEKICCFRILETVKHTGCKNFYYDKMGLDQMSLEMI